MLGRVIALFTIVLLRAFRVLCGNKKGLINIADEWMRAIPGVDKII
jgi:hypothetical protein